MLEVDRKKRITAEKMLEHRWFKKWLEQGQEEVKLSPEIIQSLKRFKGQSILKKAACNILVKMLQPKDIEDLRRVFESIDKDNSGLIEVKELEQVIRNQKGDLSGS